MTGRGLRAGRRATRSTALLLGGLALAGCREPTAPYEAVDRVDESMSLPRQLTFSTGDDRSPTWSQEGGRVLYAAEGLASFVESEGVLLELPAEGGAASTLLPLVQFPGGPAPWLATPLDGGGGAVIWMELFGVRGDNLCPGTVVQCMPEGGTDGVAPNLSELRLHVGSPESPPGPDDTLLAIPVSGVAELPANGGGSRFAVANHPFQQLFNAERSAVFRPSQEPGGDRIVFSDGLRLLTWRPGDTQAQPIPGTEDAVHAAWSPDGQWIAFTSLVRGEPEPFECQHFTPLGPVCTQARIDYAILERRVTIVRPDGGDRTDVGPGDDPAWVPGTQRLAFRRDGQIWTSAIDGSDARLVEGTAGGREPAPSPDGTLLAFARLDPTRMTHDIFLVSLAGGS